MRRVFAVIWPLCLGMVLWLSAGAALAGTTGPAQVVAKYTNGDLFQVDANGNFVWNGTAGGDKVTTVAPGAPNGTPLVGNDGELCKSVGSDLYCDANGNGTWNGNAGGDLATSFAASAGAGTFLFADTTGDGVKEIVKYVNDTFLVDANQNNVWNGTAGGDQVQSVAPGAPDGVPFACDCDGDANVELGKVVTATSDVFIDLNGNGSWNGNAGGDSATSFASAGGAGLFVFANVNATLGDDISKYYDAGDFFQVDENGNRVWNGTAGGDQVCSVAPGAASGAPCAIDPDGDGSSALCKTTAASEVFVDKNENCVWNGNAGGDVAATFAGSSGAGLFVVLPLP